MAKFKKYVVAEGSTYASFNNKSNNNNIRCHAILLLLVRFRVLPIHHNGMNYTKIIIIVIVNFKSWGIS